ncbi:hypothetical protein NQ318_013288 [Aromia moschata]|uniref:Uncharacterized protein n=1 Tax=Aromia moschata TaxID=1265417 RepID=A0AAV8XW25_9CUCU|nr:hypothetical protein NQ318_013288 [Aromia moschata]
MDLKDKLKKKLHNALKLSGFNIRREFCSLIVDKFLEEGIELEQNAAFDNVVKDLCTSLENQCLSEKKHRKRTCMFTFWIRPTRNNIQRDRCFRFPQTGVQSRQEDVFLRFAKSKMLTGADTKAKMFLERYSTVLQRTKRNFAQNVSDNERDKLKLQTVDYLLTLSHVTLDRTLILGALLQVSEGKYYLEDPTGMVQLNLTHAKYHGGFFVENSFVLVNGYYEDKILTVSTIVLPPGEEYRNSRPSFGHLNYFGGMSNVVLRDSQRLKQHMAQNKNEMIMLFSDVMLDHPQTFTFPNSRHLGITELLAHAQRVFLAHSSH